VRDTDAYRIVFSEADFLPGLIVDRYNDLLSLQVLTQAMDTEVARQAILAELSERLAPQAIIERVDPRVRELEQLPERSSSLLQGEKKSTVFTMNGFASIMMLLRVRKRGLFSISGKTMLQRPSVLAAKRWTFSVITADLLCTWRNAVPRSPESIAPDRRSKSRTGTLN